MMQAAVVPSPADLLRSQIEAALSHRIPSALTPREKQRPLTIPTGVPAVDALTGGVPRGCLTEICGPASSGRTSLLLALLAQVTARGEVCALVDASDAFDPAGAAAAGVDLPRVLWVRCSAGAQLSAVSYQPSAKPATETQRHRGIESLGDRVIERFKKHSSNSESNHSITRSLNRSILSREPGADSRERLGKRETGNGKRITENRKRKTENYLPPPLDLNAEGNNYHSWMRQVWMEDPSKLSVADAELAAGRFAVGSRLSAVGEPSVVGPRPSATELSAVSSQLSAEKQIPRRFAPRNDNSKEAAGCALRATGESVSGFPFPVSRTTPCATEGRRPTTEGFLETRNQKLETATENRKLKTENRRVTPTEQALRAADLLLQSGGFGLIVVDLADVPPPTARRVPLTSWFRFRRAVEGTPTALVVLEQEPYAKTCASLVLQLARSDEQWRCVGRSLAHATLLREMEFTAEVVRDAARKGPGRASFAAVAAISNKR